MPAPYSLLKAPTSSTRVREMVELIPFTRPNCRLFSPAGLASSGFAEKHAVSRTHPPGSRQNPRNNKAVLTSDSSVLGRPNRPPILCPPHCKYKGTLGLCCPCTSTCARIMPLMYQGPQP
ncbi:unnamed protein product [Ectocarpus sp. 12 AP-2014]